VRLEPDAASHGVGLDREDAVDEAEQDEGSSCDVAIRRIRVEPGACPNAEQRPCAARVLGERSIREGTAEAAGGAGEVRRVVAMTEVGGDALQLVAAREPQHGVVIVLRRWCGERIDNAVNTLPKGSCCNEISTPRDVAREQQRQHGIGGIVEEPCPHLLEAAGREQCECDAYCGSVEGTVPRIDLEKSAVDRDMHFGRLCDDKTVLQRQPRLMVFGRGGRMVRR
jgi:hypothetical protein